MILWVSESRPDVSIPPSVIVLGMAGSGKTSFVQVNAEKMKKKMVYLIVSEADNASTREQDASLCHQPGSRLQQGLYFL